MHRQQKHRPYLLGRRRNWGRATSVIQDEPLMVQELQRVFYQKKKRQLRSSASKKAALLGPLSDMVAALALVLLGLRRGTPPAEKPAAPLIVCCASGRATVLFPSSGPHLPSPAGNLCLLDFPSCGPHVLPPHPAGGKGNRASRYGSAGLELLLLRRGMSTALMPTDCEDPSELGAQGTLHPGVPDESIKFTDAHHKKLITAMDAMKGDMENIKSEMNKIISGLAQHGGVLKDLKNEVVHQGTIQRLVTCTVLVVTMALGFFVWMFHDEWMNRAGSLVKVWAGEALYEFTGGWFGKKR